MHQTRSTRPKHISMMSTCVKRSPASSASAAPRRSSAVPCARAQWVRPCHPAPPPRSPRPCCCRPQPARARVGASVLVAAVCVQSRIGRGCQGCCWIVRRCEGCYWDAPTDYVRGSSKGQWSVSSSEDQYRGGCRSSSAVRFVSDLASTSRRCRTTPCSSVLCCTSSCCCCASCACCGCCGCCARCARTCRSQCCAF
jgi:hypothetical protein